MDTRPIKAKNNESGTITALLTAGEVTTAHVSPVPENAPGLIFMNPGTSEEECIYYKERDAGLGTISGLTRDIENQNGGVGREAQANAPWETLQSVRYVNNLVDILIEGYLQETNDVAYVSAASFTVKTNRSAFYTKGRIVRFDDGAIGIVSADATYAAGTGLTTVLVTGTVPNPLVTVELGIQHKGRTDIFASGTDVNTGTSDTTIVTPKAIADSTIVFANSLAYQCIINGGFTVNQRVYASNATLAAGTYGHDRWKAGASGGDYTFTQLAQSTQITIKSGKSLIQVIEDKNVIGGTYTLSWTGTAKARFGKDSATPSGAYAASPITITGQTAGTVMSVEFNEGTLSNVQLNLGSVALPFMPKSFEEELRACQRYYEKSYNTETAPGTVTITGCITNLSNDTFNAAGGVGNKFSVTKRITPTITLYSTQTGSSGKVYDVSASTDNSTASASETGMSGFRIISSTNGFTTNHYYLYHWVAEAEL